MTLEEGQQLVRSFNRPDFKLFIDRAGIHQGPDGDYSLVVEPVEGEQQIFVDTEKANWALIEWMFKSAHANDRYFTLAEDGTLKECDWETWINNWPNREKTRTKITCSPEIEATICFVGCAPSMIHLDEDVKLWNAQFYTSVQDQQYGGTAFKTFEEAKAFVDRYIAKGCPPFGLPFAQFLAECNRSSV
ncbi:MAG: hypothetical protein WB696_03780 [Chthoniobacterales bacterium]